MKKATFILLIVLFLFSALLTAQEFFDSQFDGIWSAYLWTDRDFAYGNFPVVLVLNSGVTSAQGVALTLNDPGQNITGWTVQRLDEISVKNKVILIDMLFVDRNSEKISKVNFKLRYNSKGNFLKGKFTSDKTALGNGSVTFYHSSRDFPFSGFWTGNKPDDFNTMLNLYDSKGLKGRGLALDVFGNILDIVATEKNIKGRVADNNYPYSFDLSFKGNTKSLTGTFKDIYNNSYKVTLLPPGTTGKKPRIKKFTPATIDITDTSAASDGIKFAITGRNLSLATIIFADNPGITFEQSKTDSKSISGDLMIDPSLANGTKIKIYLLNPDNQYSNFKTITVNKSGGGEEIPVGFSAEIQPIFNSSCIACHGGSGGLSLDSPSYNQIVNVTSSRSFLYISPSDPDNSYLLMKIEGDSRIAGSPMPLGGTLNATEKTLIRKWIEQGALEN